MVQRSDLKNRDQWPVTRGQESGIRSRGSGPGIRGRGSGAGDQGPGVRSQKSGARNLTPDT